MIGIPWFQVAGPLAAASQTLLQERSYTCALKVDATPSSVYSLLHNCYCRCYDSITPMFTPTLKPSACVELAYLIPYMLIYMCVVLGLYSTDGLNRM
jgi:hypothetical protein